MTTGFFKLPVVFFFFIIVFVTFLSASSAKSAAKDQMKPLPDEIELYRDRKWRREESLRVETVEDVEAMVEDLGFCLGLTDARRGFHLFISPSAAAVMPICRETFRRITKPAGRGS